MSRLNPAMLHVRFAEGSDPNGPLYPRWYTLTHSDKTGDLFLTIAPEVNRKQISGWYTRLMRDEVIAEWQSHVEGSSLHVYCHVSGGLVLGGASMRGSIFRRELPLVLEAFRFGDRALLAARQELDQAPVWVHFESTHARYQKVEHWGTPAEYTVQSDGGVCTPTAGD